MLSFTQSFIYQRKYALPSLTAPAPVSLLPFLVSSHLDENGVQWLQLNDVRRGDEGFRGDISLYSFKFYLLLHLYVNILLYVKVNIAAKTEKNGFMFCFFSFCAW